MKRIQVIYKAWSLRNTLTWSLLLISLLVNPICCANFFQLLPSVIWSEEASSFMANTVHLSHPTGSCTSLSSPVCQTHSSININRKIFASAGIWTADLLDSSQALYHWATEVLLQTKAEISLTFILPQFNTCILKAGSPLYNIWQQHVKHNMLGLTFSSLAWLNMLAGFVEFNTFN